MCFLRTFLQYKWYYSSLFRKHCLLFLRFSFTSCISGAWLRIYLCGFHVNWQNRPQNIQTFPTFYDRFTVLKSEKRATQRNILARLQDTFTFTVLFTTNFKMCEFVQFFTLLNSLASRLFQSERSFFR